MTAGVMTAGVMTSGTASAEPTLASFVAIEQGPVLLRLDEQGIAHLCLNRPEASNGLDMALLKALHEALIQIHGDSRVRVVLLTGAGKHFCAGGDVHTFLSKGQSLPDYIRVTTAYLQIVVAQLMRLQAPVIAAVQGYAAGGGGMGLVCMSDFVLAGESSKFLAGATRVAMVPDAGVSVTLTQLVGFRKAMEILMLNPTLGAQEAQDIGLITKVVPDAQLQEQALILARQLALGAPAALAGTKRLLWNGIGQNVEAAMPEENQMQAQLCSMSDALEGLRAVIEKRAPVFTGR
jgi:2-(1,2-epoxy-1,2-dihydrophenyl)acetyl-CoA isomerase